MKRHFNAAKMRSQKVLRTATLAGALLPVTVPTQALPQERTDPGFSIILDSGNSFSGPRAYENFSMSRGYSNVTISHCLPKVGVEGVTAGSGVQFFGSLTASACQGNVQSNPVKTRRMIESLLPQIPTLRSVLEQKFSEETGLSSKLTHALFSGSLKKSDLSDKDLKSISQTLTEAGAKYGVAYPADMVLQAIQTLPPGQSITLNQLSQSMHILANTLRDTPALPPYVTKGDLLKAADGSDALGNDLSHTDTVLTNIRNFDGQAYAIDHLAGTFNYSGNGDAWIPGVEIAGGVRMPVFTTQGITALIEGKIGANIQYWPNSLGVNGVCIQPEAGVAGIVQTRVTNALTMTGRAGIGTDLPCVFMNSSVNYTEKNLIRGNLSLSMNYAFGVDNPLGAPIYNEASTSPFENLELKLFSAYTLSDATSFHTMGTKGLSLETVTPSIPAIGFGVDRRFDINKDFGLYGTAGMEFLGGVSSLTRKVDEARTRQLVEDRIPTGADLKNVIHSLGLTDQDLKRLGVSGGTVTDDLRKQLVGIVMDSLDKNELTGTRYTGTAMFVGTIGKTFDQLPLEPSLYLLAGAGIKPSLTEYSDGSVSLGIAGAFKAGVGSELNLGDMLGADIKLFGEASIGLTSPEVFTGDKGMGVTNGFKMDQSVMGGLKLSF